MGGRKGGGSPTSTTTVERELAPEQRQLLNAVIPIAEQTLNRGVKLYPGSAIATQNPYETQAQSAAVNLAGNLLPQMTAETIANQSFLQSGQAGTIANPALQAAINSAVAPIVDNYTQQVLPSIRGGAISAGGLGGSRQGIAEGLASQALFRSMGETAAPIANEAFLRGLQAQTTALGLAPQTAQMSLLPANVLSGVGQQQRQFEQAKLTEEAQRYITDQLLQFELAKQVAGLAFGIPGGSTTTTASAFIPKPESNPLMGGLGGAMTGASIGSAFGPWGAAIGGVGGGLIGLFSS